MPGFKSFISRTSLRRIGFGISSLGSLPGFSSSFRISVSVISPIPSSSASSFLFLIRFSSPEISFASFDAFCTAGAFFFVEVSAELSKLTPPMAAARALPIAVLVLCTLTVLPFCSSRFFAVLAALLPFFCPEACAPLLPEAFLAAACFWASLMSSIVSPSFAINCSAAS